MDISKSKIYNTLLFPINQITISIFLASTILFSGNIVKIIGILLFVFLFILHVRIRSSLPFLLIIGICVVPILNLINLNQPISEIKTINGIVSEELSGNEFSKYLVISTISDSYLTKINTFEENYKYLDQVEITGKFIPIENTSEFSDQFQSYLISKGIALYVQNNSIQYVDSQIGVITHIQSLRTNLMSSLSNKSSSVNTGLTQGIIYGQKANIPPDVEENLQKTGLTHIVSASGFNVAILYILIKILPVNRNLKTIFGISSIWIYILIIGINILPAIRAGLMLSYILIGNLFGKQQNIFTNMSLSAALILLFSPTVINNISFILSFSSITGILLFQNRILKFIENKGLKIKIVSETLSATIAATITTMPIGMLVFSQVSIISILANLFIVPVLGILTITGMIGSILFLFWESFGRLVVSIPHILVDYILNVVNILSKLPFATTSSWFIVIILLALFTILLRNEKKK